MRRLPQVALATFTVVGMPIVVVVALSASGTVTSVVALMAVSVALSLGASYLGSAFWTTRKGSGDMLFADLMLWGWLRRWFLERQLANAVSLLGLREPAEGTQAQLSSSRRVRLLRQLAAGLEARYPDTHGHSRRVARHAATIAKRMGLERDEVARIRTAATVHDVGKIDIPSTIINKPGALTDDEFATVKQHAEIGARMVVGLGDGELVRIVRHHHERLDGAGYPDGLAGTEIPLGARIIAVADTFDAITSTRPYRPAMRHKDGLAVLAAEAGTQLDAEAVRAFRRYYSGYRPVALWALLLNGSRQFLASLIAEAKLGGAVTAVALASVAAGEVATHSPNDNAQSPPPQKAGAVATALPGNAGFSTLTSNRPGAEGDDTESGGLGGAGTRGGVKTGSSDETSQDESGSAVDGGGSATGDEGGSASGSGNDSKGAGSGNEGDSSIGDVVSSTGDSASKVVSNATNPVSSTVGSVVETVDSTVKQTVESTLPKEVSVQPILPNVPPVKLPVK